MGVTKLNLYLLRLKEHPVRVPKKPFVFSCYYILAITHSISNSETIQISTISIRQGIVEKKAMIRKWTNRKEIPTPKTQVGKELN